MTAPLVPADVDLRDFAFTPVEFDRLFKSETWLLSNDAEKVAAITLWGRAWSQVPAGSLPNDDRLLAHLSGTGPRWKRLKPMALRNWRQATDGRLYHPVVCEKVLEAWLEKLATRLSSGAGNAKRWNIEFDPAPIEAAIAEARQLLAKLNPQSRQLTKKRPPGVSPRPKQDAAGNPGGIPAGVPLGSQETGTGTLKASSDTYASTGGSEGSAALARALVEVDSNRFAECSDAHPDLVAAAVEGITPAELAAVAKAKPGKGIGYLVQAARGKRADAIERAGNGSGPAPAQAADPAVVARAQARHERDAAISRINGDFGLGLIADEAERDRRIEAAHQAFRERFGRRPPPDQPAAEARA